MNRAIDRKRFTTASALAVAVVLLAGACGNRAPQLPQAAGLNGPQLGTPKAETPSTDTAATDAGGETGATAPSSAASSGVTTPSAGSASASPKPGAASGAAAKPGASSAAAAKPGASAQPGTATGGAAAGGTSSPGASTAGGGAAGGSQAGGQLPGSVSVPGPSSQGVSDDKIRVGVLAPVSGAAGFLGENEVDAVRAYTELANSKGGVKGRKYQMIVVDTQFEPAVEATGAKRLVEQDKVFALISVLGDSAAPYVTSKGIPDIVFGVVPPPFSSKFPTTYPLGMTTVGWVADMAYQLTQVLKLPIKSTAILYENQNIPIQTAVPFMKKAWEIWGVDVKSTDRFNLSDADCTQLVIKMRDLGIDFWQVGQSLGWLICQQAMGRQNYTPPQGRGGPYSADEHFVGQAGLASVGVYAQMHGVQIEKNLGEPFPWLGGNKAPAVEEYLASMKRFSPSSADIGSLENVWTQTFWSMGKLLDDAIKHQSDAITWKGVNQWIQGQKSWNGGLLNSMNFTPNCKSGGDGWIFKWEKNAEGRLVQSDWKPYGGPVHLPTEAKNKIFPGAGDCYVTAISDAVS